MDIIELAREIGRELQKDPNYLAMRAASDACDKDTELQNLIGQFNLTRMSLSNEAQKEQSDEQKIQQLNTELRQTYAQIMQSPNMAAYNAAKQNVDAILNRVSAITGQSADGENPDTADYHEESSCGGNCGSCGGCH